MSSPPELLYPVVTPEIPADMVRMFHDDLGDSRCPAAASDDCYFTEVEHNFQK